MKIIYSLCFLILLCSCTDHRKKGEALFLVGEYEKAIKSFDKVLGLDPYDHYTLYNRGRAKQELGLHQEAIYDFDMAIKWDYQNSDYYLGRGKSYFALDAYSSSQVDFKNATFRNPKNFQAHLMLGKAYWKMDKVKDALYAFETANEIDDSNPGGRYYRGLARATVGNKFGAIDDFTFYIKYESENHIILYNRALCYMALGYNSWALSDLDKAIDLKPDYAEAIIQRAFVKIGMRKRDSACLEVSKLAQQGNENAIYFMSQYCR
jgi:tetratricopeptide (TPR) repeat protein